MKKIVLVFVLLFLLTALSACRTQNPGKNPTESTKPTWTQPIVTEKEEEKPVFTVTIGESEAAPNAYYTWVGEYGNAEDLAPSLRGYSRDLPILLWSENVSYSVAGGGTVTHVRVFDVDCKEISETGSTELPELPERGLFYVAVGVSWGEGSSATGCEFLFRIAKGVPYFLFSQGEPVPMLELQNFESRYDEEKGLMISVSEDAGFVTLAELVESQSSVYVDESFEELLLIDSESFSVNVYDATMQESSFSAPSISGAWDTLYSGPFSGTWIAVAEVPVLQDSGESIIYWYIVKFTM